MLNGLFVFLVVASVLFAAATGQMQAVTDAVLVNARKAVELSLKLVGVMGFFLGLMRVAEDGGLLRWIARIVAPVMRRLFPDVPADHPAMSAMILNIASNLLGLANAATPFGIKAMEELDRLNGRKGTATNPMVLFLAINTAGFTLLPSNVIALRSAAGSADAAGIFFPTWVASGSATIVGIAAALLLARLPRFRRTAPTPVDPEVADPPAEADGNRRGASPAALAPETPRPVPWRRGVMWVLWLAYAGFLARFFVVSAATVPALELAREVLSYWVLPAIVAAMVLFGWSRGVPVYESVVEGAKEGFQVALRIIPFLIAILVGVGMFRASGALAVIVDALGPWTARIGMPAETLPMAILRPLSGSGALGVMVEAMETHGPDSLIGYMVSTFQGSTETTFYVLAVYFGAVGVKRTRHALPACLCADAAGIFAAVFVVNALF